MKKLSILALLVIGLLVFVGCEETPVSTTLEWTTVATEWTNDDEGQLSYVSQEGSTWIDLGWYEIPGDNTSTYEMCFLEEENYEVANNVLTGQYTDNGDDTEIFYDIVITFDYNASTDQVSFSCDGEGILEREILLILS